MMTSIIVVFVLFKCFEKIVIFGKSLVSSSFGHVESTIFNFFSPESNGLLPFIAHIGI